MANLVFNISPSVSEPVSNESNEKYRDLSQFAVRNFNYTAMKPVYLSDYIKYLCIEQKKDYVEAQKNLNPDIINQLSVVICEGQDLPVRDSTDSAVDVTLKAIAVEVSCGYDAALDLYNKFTRPYRWRIGKLIDIYAIQNSLEQIFTWIPGERVINPEFGSKLQYYLYEGITKRNVDLIIAEIKNSVSIWEPRVVIENVIDASTVEDHENNTINLEIEYSIPTLPGQRFKYSYRYHRSNQ